MNADRHPGVEDTVGMVRVRLASRGSHGKQIKVIVEKHPDGYVAYPLGVKGVVVGQGDS